MPYPQCTSRVVADFTQGVVHHHSDRQAQGDAVITDGQTASIRRTTHFLLTSKYSCGVDHGL